jgi:capsid protein
MSLSRDGKLNLNRFQALQLEASAVDGEAFTRTVIGRGFRHGLGLQPIDADLVAENVNRRAHREGVEVRMGVEVDLLGRPVATTSGTGPTTCRAARAAACSASRPARSSTTTARGVRTRRAASRGSRA